ncbi:hypothetical protein [Brevibacillus sp. HB2.2]|uniref:hypothetical protein n=1 Tax=Brevibacillus sp. HB2.2 TaxID=2738846 RepID=UPI00156ABAB4|nr:hypothetical protein [Brevibacillus sp. HB2.2]NRS51007.1 hypothetical protein [Brevibacillus sp. HB2.2]
MFRYNSRVGVMLIYFDKRVGKYALQIGQTIYDHHDSAQSAADNVYMHVTGCSAWDRLDGQVLDAPTDLSEWIRV